MSSRFAMVPLRELLISVEANTGIVIISPDKL